MPPTIVFGDTSTVGIENIRPALLKYGITKLDTAAFYGEGQAEGQLGAANASKDFIIDTKIMGGPLNSGTLSPDKVDASSKNSLEQLRVEKVNVLYVHMPDLKTPLEEQAKGFNDAFEKGRYKELGICNMMPDMFRSWMEICEKNGYVKPTWYQGQYNLIIRTLEDILFPELRQAGVHFAAFSPVGGGFLRGNFTPNGATGERFVSQGFGGHMYRYFYDRPEFHQAYEKLKSLSEETGVETDELSLRWLMHHSKLQDDDTIILGASKLYQFEDTMQKLQKGPLDDKVADALDKLCTPDMRTAGLGVVDATKLPM